MTLIDQKPQQLEIGIEMPRHTEPNINNALAEVLGEMLPKTRVSPESTQTFSKHPGRHADILITADNQPPVVVESEYEPAISVESDARERLGLEVRDQTNRVEAAVAVRYPSDLGDARQLRRSLKKAQLSYCVFILGIDGDPETDVDRFPESGWLSGSVADLSDLIRLVAVSQSRVEKATDALQRGIDLGESVLRVLGETKPGVTQSIADLLGMVNSIQSRRMACAILANAMVFHEYLSGLEGVPNLARIYSKETINPKRVMLQAWANILKVNYWPIFAIAKDILEELPARDASNMVNALAPAAEAVTVVSSTNSHDLTGKIFQRLIADRKYLATFYTRPPSAALLARLAVAKMGEIDWANRDAIGELRIADFACGTGALLSAVYEQIAVRHEREGGDLSTLHPVMMQEVMYGCDVMPSAIHITGSTLSGLQPMVPFGKSRLYTLAYGRQEDGCVKIGSLELLQSSSALSLFNTSDPAWQVNGDGEESANQIVADVPDEGFDLVIMNPPFTSNTKHRDAEHGVLNAAFAAFNASEEDQVEMAKLLRSLAKSTSYHGHAGLASAFVALADKKVKPGGVVAFVLPFTATNGSSWTKFRELISTRYTDITVVSIAEVRDEVAFSSDTSIAECLVIARKLDTKERPALSAEFISLHRRPADLARSWDVSKNITSNLATRTLRDGPYGGMPIYEGTTLTGEVLEVPIDRQGAGWGSARIRDASLAQVAYALSNSKLWLPAEPRGVELRLTEANQIAQRGFDHQMLVNDAHGGPFAKMPAISTATFPALWNHSARSERFMLCNPDSSLRVKPGMEKRAHTLWQTAGRSHITLDFRFNSQSLSAALTEHACIGGTAWPNVNFVDPSFDYPFALWCNSTLGLLLFWWHASRQQDGRGRTTIVGIESLPILDFRTLSEEQLDIAERIFDEFRDKELMPAYLADADPNRALLDRRVLCDLLGFDEDIYQGVRRLTAKWCAEPSVHGGKQRPEEAKLLI